MKRRKKERFINGELEEKDVLYDYKETNSHKIKS